MSCSTACRLVAGDGVCAHVCVYVVVAGSSEATQLIIIIEQS